MDSAMLRDLGVSVALAQRLVEHGWMMRLSPGAYLLTGDAPTRDGTIAFLRRRIRGLHVGGKAALAWHGVFHNIAFRERIVLWGCNAYKFPPWVGETIVFSYQTTRLFDSGLPYDFQIKPMPYRSQEVLVSVPERALLELASEIGKGQSIEEAENLVITLRNIRPPILHALLSHCNYLKVLRTVRHLGAVAGYSWADGLPALIDQLIDERHSTGRGMDRN